MDLEKVHKGQGKRQKLQHRKLANNITNVFYHESNQPLERVAGVALETPVKRRVAMSGLLQLTLCSYHIQHLLHSCLLQHSHPFFC